MTTSGGGPPHPGPDDHPPNRADPTVWGPPAERSPWAPPLPEQDDPATGDPAHRPQPHPPTAAWPPAPTPWAAPPPAPPPWAPPPTAAWPAAQPQYTQPQYTQPQYTQPQFGQPPWAPPGSGPGWPPAPPPPGRGRGTLIALLLVGALVLAGLGVGTYLLIGANRAEPVALTTIRTGGLTYDVPSDWTQGGEPLESRLGLDFTGVARGPAYECGGRSFLRGIVASALVSSPVPADAAASSSARVLATDYYSTRGGPLPEVTVGPVRSVEVGGVPASLVEATATTPVDDGCLATDGVVKVLAVPLDGGDLAVLVVNGDVAGGPADAPPNPDPATIDAIVASARPTGG